MGAILAKTAVGAVCDLIADNDHLFATSYRAIGKAMSDLVVATKHVATYAHRGEHYVILQGDNHQFYAVHTSSPYFCFEGDTVEDANKTAIRALEYFYQENFE